MVNLIAYAATEPAANAGGIGALGLDVWALLFQVINFAILLLALRFLAYRPLLAMLRHRRETIEEGLRNAQDSAEAQAQTVIEQRRLLQDARTQAHVILAQSKTRAAEVIRTAEVDAHAQVKQIISQGEALLAHHAAEVQAQLKKETLQLVADATEAVIEVKLDPKRDQKLITQAIARANSLKK